MNKNIKSFDKYVSEMARPRDPNKPKRGFADGYPSYDPTKLGYGNPDVWANAFKQRMGYDEAEEILRKNDIDPYIILGIPRSATQEEIKKAYRKKAFETHPDKNLDKDTTEDFKVVQAAYVKLSEGK